MIPVIWLSEVETPTGVYGYSALQKEFFGSGVKRKTMLFLRDECGRLIRCVLVNAEEVR